MMDKEQIIDHVEKLINGEVDDYTLLQDDDANVVESALENVVIRLINTYKKYCAGKAGLSDYISTLRNFMLSFQTELRVEDHGVLDHNYLGIYFNPLSQKQLCFQVDRVSYLQIHGTEIMRIWSIEHAGRVYNFDFNADRWRKESGHTGSRL